MRILLMLRGLPASGKSTWVRENHLQQYTVSSDELRILLGGITMDIDGRMKISQSVNQTMWEMLYNILEKRFEVGAFTILDATNIKTKDMNSVKKLAKEYRYRIYCVDFTDVSVEECIMRDMSRGLHMVGETVIRKMANSLNESKVPSGIEIVKPDKAADLIYYDTVDLNEYKKIHHIGDIHGCYTALKNYFDKYSEGRIKEDEFYIFMGDYIDRGLENAEIVKFLASICEFPNVILLEGNHDRYLKMYHDNVVTPSRTFNNVTRLELDRDVNSKMYCSRIVKKLRQCFMYSYGDEWVMCTHGGLSKFYTLLPLVNTNILINGVGKYDDVETVEQNFLDDVHNDKFITHMVQIHGHRNPKDNPIDYISNNYNLCSKVEFGGDLRCVVLESVGNLNVFHSIYIENKVYNEDILDKFTSVEQMVRKLSNSDLIQIKPQVGTNIASFNFTRDAFVNKSWNFMTVKARGLFVNTKTNKIVARGYDKFFNLNEMEFTKWDNLKETLVFPCEIARKENGFLGLVGYDEETQRIIFCSKSTMSGEYAENFKNILLSKTTYDKLKTYFNSNPNTTLVFECVDPVNDPHIIKYNNEDCILLDIINNEIDFKYADYATITKVADSLGLSKKHICFTVNTFEELQDVIGDAIAREADVFEGYVIRDSQGFMFKWKTPYYNEWKALRGQVDRILKGYAISKEYKNNEFIKWFIEYYKKDISEKHIDTYDIISLRKEYYKELFN